MVLTHDMQVIPTICKTQILRLGFRSLESCDEIWALYDSSDFKVQTKLSGEICLLLKITWHILSSTLTITL